MFLDYMESVLGEAKMNSSEVEAQWDCPFCDDSRTRFRMNVYKLRGHCFNCQWKGNAVSFVRDFNRVSTAEAFDIVSFYQDFTPLPEDVYEEVFDQLFLEDYEPEKKYIPLPGDFKLLHDSSSVRAKPYWKYAKKRNLTEKQIELHGVGWCPEGEIILPNKNKTYIRERLIVQVFDDDGSPVYWNARAIRNKIKPKSFNPVGGLNTINKTDVLFNLNNAKKTGVAVITEGVFDATTVGNSGVGTFGKTLSAKQMLLLIKAELEAVYVMFDPDAKNEAMSVCSNLSKHIPNTFLCNLKNGDPNEIGRKGCLEVLKDAEPFDSFTELRHKLLG
jgi:DNA primase